MKKTLTILLVLAVAMCGLFADPTTSNLLLKTSKTADNIIGFMTSAPTLYADVVPNETVIDTITIKTDSQDIGYAVYKSSSSGAVTVTLKSDKFIGYKESTYSTENGDTIGYTISFSAPVKKTNDDETNGNCTVYSTDYLAGSTEINLFAESAAGTKPRFGSVNMDIAMASADVSDALEGFYKSTVTLSTTAW